MRSKRFIYVLALLVSLSFFSSCVSYSHGRGNRGLPPGQAKKIYGTKSAKPFAPGQRKKNNNKGKKKNKSKKNNHRSSYFIPAWKF